MSPFVAHRVISLRCGIWSLSEQSGHRLSSTNQARFMSTRANVFNAGNGDEWTFTGNLSVAFGKRADDRQLSCGQFEGKHYGRRFSDCAGLARDSKDTCRAGKE